MKPKWFEIAENEVGTKEVKGGENPRILAYHASTTLKAREDEIPWCSSFVNWCITQAGLKGTNSAAAISWLNYGVSTEPKEGAITIIRQKKKGPDQATGSSSGNHVGFLVKTEGIRIYLLGGNQSDQVKISGFNLASYEVLSYRWPKEA